MQGSDGQRAIAEFEPRVDFSMVRKTIEILNNSRMFAWMCEPSAPSSGALEGVVYILLYVKFIF